MFGVDKQKTHIGKEYGFLFRRELVEGSDHYKPRKEEQGLYLEDAAVAG